MDAIKLGIAKAGDVVFIECDKGISPAREAKIRAELESHLAGTGIKGVLLSPGLRIARSDDRAGEPVAKSERRIGFIQ
ncbi:MAG: hypothetical protein E6Q76_12775 [Rhizobium sp.]|nr:MAG: hypothetical protein E6Q76_12775 [Rhizobium sp.]